MKKTLCILMSLVMLFTALISPMSAQAATLKAPASVSATCVTATAVKLKWKKVSSATGYYVYRSTKKSSGYKKIKTLSKNSYTSYINYSLTSGKKYYYKVYSYKGKTKKASKTVSCTPKSLKVTGVKTIKRSTTSATIFWNKSESASGYSIYRATSKNGKYSLIKSTSALSYTNSKLTSNKTYYYKVRAFKTVNKKKIYGAYSDIKTYSPKAVKTNALNGSYYFDTKLGDMKYDYSTDTISVKGLRIDTAKVKKSIADTYRVGSEFTIKYKPSTNTVKTIKYKVTKIETGGGTYRALILKCLSCVSKNTKTGKTTKSTKAGYNCLYYSEWGPYSYTLCNYGTSDYAYDYTQTISVTLYMNDVDCLDECFYNYDDLYDFYWDNLDDNYFDKYYINVDKSYCTYFSSAAA